MSKTTMVWLVAAVIGAGSAAAQQAPERELTLAECAVEWTEVSGGASTISEEDAEDLVVDFGKADTDGDDELSRTEFMAACEEGNVRGTATTGPGGGSR